MAKKRKHPRVSVLCYYFNEEKYLKALIESVLDQSYEDFELVLLDNASTDSSREIAHSFRDKRIVYVDSDKSISGPDFDFARENNVGFNACKGDLVAIVGGDDLMFPDRLAHQVALFDADPDLDVVHAMAPHINGDSDLLPDHFSADPYHQWNFLRIIYTYGQLAYPTCMIKRSSLAKIGGFQGGYAPDYWLWLDTATTWKFRYLPENVVYYRMHDRSASHSPDGNLRTHQATVKIRAEARSRYSIEDFFPEINLCSDKKLATAAAYLELGNLAMGGGMANIQLAFDEYKKADDILSDHPAIVHNAAIVMSLDGQHEEAAKTFATLPADNPFCCHSRMVAQGFVHQPFRLADGRGICPELYHVARNLPAGLWKSDGTVT